MARRRQRIKVRRRLRKQFDDRCFWCGAEAGAKAAAATIDHLFPKTDPRRHAGAPTLKVLACHRCNSLRGDMPFEHFAIVAAAVQLIKVGVHGP